MGNSEAVVEVLMEAGVDVHVAYCYWDLAEPPLVCAAREGTIVIIRALVRHGADGNHSL